MCPFFWGEHLDSAQKLLWEARRKIRIGIHRRKTGDGKHRLTCGLGSRLTDVNMSELEAEKVGRGDYKR
jgi:hypothetical protein